MSEYTSPGGHTYTASDVREWLSNFGPVMTKGRLSVQDIIDYGTILDQKPGTPPGSGPTGLR